MVIVSDRARPEPEEAEVTPESSADLTMAGLEAGNSNPSQTQDETNKVTKQLISLAVKTVNEYNENLRPYAELIKREKGVNRERELLRVKDLKDKMIKAMIDFISAQRQAVKEEQTRFLGDKDSRNKRATVNKTQQEDKKKETELKDRELGLDEFRQFTEQMAFEKYSKRDDFKKMLNVSNTYHIKGLLEIVRFFFGQSYVEEKGKNMKRPQLIDTITLEVIKQFPRPCLNCQCFLDEKFVTPREAAGKATCQICGSYLCESCMTLAGTNLEQTLAVSDCNQSNADFFNATNQVEQKVGLADITCSTCYKFVLEPVISYFANSNDKKQGAEIKSIVNVKKYREGQNWYPFSYKAVSHKEPSAGASSTDRPMTGQNFVDEDEEATVEIEEDGETEQTIKNLKSDIENIKQIVNKIAEDKEDKSEALNKVIEDKFKQFNNTFNGVMKDNKEKVEATLKAFKEKTKELNNIKTMMTKLSEERTEDRDGINNLKSKMSEIKDLLDPLGFAKQVIEISGGSDKILEDIRASRRAEIYKTLASRNRFNFDQMEEDLFDADDIANADAAEKEAAAAEEEEKKKEKKKNMKPK